MVAMDGRIARGYRGRRRRREQRLTKTNPPTLSLEFEQVRRELQGKRKARAPVLGVDRLGRRCSESTLERRGGALLAGVGSREPRARARADVGFRVVTISQ